MCTHWAERFAYIMSKYPNHFFQNGEKAKTSLYFSLVILTPVKYSE